MDSMDRPAPAKADVSLRVPADGAYVSVLRTMTAGLAARLDFTVDDIEDLRIAVGEACALVLPEAVPGGDLVADFRLTPGTLTISVGVPTAGPRTADLDSFAWQVLSTLHQLRRRGERRVTLRGHLHHRVDACRSQARGPTAEMTDTSGDSRTHGSEERAARVRLRSQELFAVYRDDRSLGGRRVSTHATDWSGCTCRWSSTARAASATAASRSRTSSRSARSG